MNQNARFMGLLAVMLVVLGGLWYAIWGRSSNQPATVQTAGTTQATDDEPRARADAPDITSSRRPSRFAPSATTSSANPRETRKGARSGPSAIRGQVTMEEDLLPVGGTELQLIWKDRDAIIQVHDEDSQWTTTSDGKGFFRFEKLPAGNFTVIAQKDDLAAVGSAYINPREPEDHVVDLQLHPVGAIAGRVVNEQQEPIQDVLVALGRGKSGTRDIYGGDSQTKTDADGQFTLNFVQKGTWTIEAKAEGYAVGEVLDVPHDGTGVQIVLKHGGMISGTVVAAESSKPQPNIAVRLRGGGRLNAHEVTSGTDGAFAIADLADGAYQLTIEKQAHILAGQAPSIQIEDANSIDNIQLVVAMGGSVSGIATDAETGTPIVGMAFRPRSPQGGYASAEATTDEDGMYRIEGLPAGQYTVRRLWMSGYRHGESREDKQVTVGLGQEVTGIDFAVPAGLFLRGRVVDKSGEPLAQVNVESVDAENLEGETMVTDEKGRFIHRGFSPGAKLTITASKQGFSAPPLQDVVIGDSDKNDVEIVMDTGGSIAGIVVDKEGKPLVDAYVTAMPQNPEAGQQAQQASSQEEGVFKVQGLAAGTYKLQVRPPRTWREPTLPAGNDIQLTQGENVTGVRLVCDFDTGMKLAGRVIDSTGKPIRDVSVNAHSRNGNSSGYAQTDAEGKFEIVGLQAGTHWYGAHHQDYSQPDQQQEVEVPNPNMTITLRGKGTIQGRVLEAQSGQPVKTFSIIPLVGRIERIEPGNYMGTGQTFVDENGRFEIRGNDGDAALYVTAQGYAPKLHKVPGVREGQTTSGVDVRLDAGGVIEGVVTNKQGQAVAGASIYIGRVPTQEWERQQRPANATTDADGSFRIESLAAENTRVYATHGEYATASATATPAAGGAAMVNIVLGSGGVINGTIRVAGRPVASGYGVSLHVPEGEGQGYNAQSEVNGSGQFTFNGLPEGTVSLTVYGNQPGAGRRQISKQATVAADQVTTVDFDITEGTAGVEGVITRDGQPVSSASVNLTIAADDGNSENAHAQADSKGAYKLDGLPPGAATLMVYVNTDGQFQQARSFQVQLEDRRTIRHDIELSGGMRVSGSVSGVPEGWFASVSLFRGQIDVSGDLQSLYQELQGQMAGAAQITEGRFFVEGIEPGEYTVLAVGVNPQSAGQTYKKASRTINVVEGEETEVDLTVE
ncbi:MAG: carboxypeptidase regulatory-like domain-containing protein [Candidatus Hydrogenedentes bacterium]|nr:carboxypeptidase regulatory-like domain-containing protein [Candidatus Hydrogenedentota bacterium]